MVFLFFLFLFGAVASFSSFGCGCVLHLFCWVVLLGFFPLWAVSGVWRCCLPSPPLVVLLFLRLLCWWSAWFLPSLGGLWCLEVLPSIPSIGWCCCFSVSYVGWSAWSPPSLALFSSPFTWCCLVSSSLGGVAVLLLLFCGVAPCLWEVLRFSSPFACVAPFRPLGGDETKQQHHPSKEEGNAAPPKGANEGNTTKQEREKAATPPQKEEETKQHHTTEDMGKSSPTQRGGGGRQLLRENDTDGRMAVLMVTGYAQGPLCQMITEYGVNSHAHDALPTTGEMRLTRSLK